MSNFGEVFTGLFYIRFKVTPFLIEHCIIFAYEFYPQTLTGRFSYFPTQKSGRKCEVRGFSGKDQYSQYVEPITYT